MASPNYTAKDTTNQERSPVEIVRRRCLVHPLNTNQQHHHHRKDEQMDGWSNNLLAALLVQQHRIKCTTRALLILRKSDCANLI